MSEEERLAEAIKAVRAGVVPTWLRWWWWGRATRETWLAARELVAQHERAMLGAAIKEPVKALRDVAVASGDMDALRYLERAEMERLVNGG